MITWESTHTVAVQLSSQQQLLLLLPQLLLLRSPLSVPLQQSVGHRSVSGPSSWSSCHSCHRRQLQSGHFNDVFTYSSLNINVLSFILLCSLILSFKLSILSLKLMFSFMADLPLSFLNHKKEPRQCWVIQEWSETSSSFVWRQASFLPLRPHFTFGTRARGLNLEEDLLCLTSNCPPFLRNGLNFSYWIGLDVKPEMRLREEKKIFELLLQSRMDFWFIC